MTNAETFEQLFKLTEKHVKSFKEDLTTHDKNSINKRNPGTPFIHITRDTGTCLIFLDDVKLDDYNPGETVEKVVKGKKVFFDYYLNLYSRKSIYYFNGKKFARTTPEKARQIFNIYISNQEARAEREERRQKAVY